MSLAIAVAVTAAAMMMPAVPASAQQTADPPTVADLILADQLVILARGNLAGEGDPRDDQLTRAKILLDLALGLNPADSEVWQLRMELAQRRGDTERDMDALRRYCRLSPDDDTAQLRLIAHAVETRQTLDGRAALARRFVDGRSAKRFAPALRSRLAMLLAEASLETGRNADAVARLEQAVSLDPTNKQAAEMTYKLALNRGAGASEVGTALLGVVRADPMNPQPRQALALWLLASGGYDQAAVQFEVGWAIGLRRLDPGYVFRWAWCLAAAGKDTEALILLANYDAQLKQEQANASAQTRPANPQGLPVDLELLRLVIARHAELQDVVDPIAERIRAVYQQRIKAGDAQGFFEWVWFSLFFDLGPVDQKTVDQIVGQLGADHPAAARVKGWSLIRQGLPEQAAGVLKPTAPTDPFAAFGLIQATNPQDDATRTRLLRQVLGNSPSTTAGLLAIYDLGQARRMTRAGKVVQRAMRSWPSELTTPNPQPNRWGRITIKTTAHSYGYLDPIVADIELYNATGMDLALGSDGTLPTRLFIYTSSRKAGDAMPEHPPIVVDLGRRLRLSARQSINLKVRLDRSELGALLASNPFDTLTIGIAAILDPRPNTTQGHPTPGPMGATDTTPMIRREGVVLKESNLKQWLTDLSDSRGKDRMRALGRLVKAIPSLVVGGAEIKQLTTEISRSVNDYYLQADDVTQAWVVLLIDPLPPVLPLFKPVIDSATRSDDPLVRIAYLATQIDDPSSPALTAALRHDDPVIVDFASALRSGLKHAADNTDPEPSDTP